VAAVSHIEMRPPLHSIRGMVLGPHHAFIAVGGDGALVGAHAPARGRVRNLRVRRGRILSEGSGGTDPTPLGSDEAEPFPKGSDTARPAPKGSGEVEPMPRGSVKVGLPLWSVRMGPTPKG
jgi:hypothetical protein